MTNQRGREASDAWLHIHTRHDLIETYTLRLSIHRRAPRGVHLTHVFSNLPRLPPQTSAAAAEGAGAAAGPFDSAILPRLPVPPLTALPA